MNAQFPSINSAKLAFSMGEVEYRCIVCGGIHSSSDPLRTKCCINTLIQYVLLLTLAELAQLHYFTSYFNTTPKTIKNIFYKHEKLRQIFADNIDLCVKLSNAIYMESSYYIHNYLLALGSVEVIDDYTLDIAISLPLKVVQNIFQLDLTSFLNNYK